MNAKIQVVFDMSFDTSGECKSQVRFSLPDHPNMPCPENVKALVIGEIKIISAAMYAAQIELFKEEGAKR